MKTGISTACLYPELTETALLELAVRGVKTTEIFINSASELEENYVRSLMEVLREYDMTVLSMHPFTSGMEPIMLFSDYERRCDDLLEYYKRYFHAMNLLGAEILVLHGDRKDSTLPDERYFERYARLSRLGREYGILIGQENVARCRSSSVDFLAKMRKALGNEAAFVVDLKQCIRSGCDVYDVFEAVGDRLCNVHISDSAEGKDCLPLGQGVFDFAVLIRYLKAKRYEGGLILELYRNNYHNCNDLSKSIKLLNDLL